MQRNQGLPIQRLVVNDNAVDIHVGLRAEQAEMHRRAVVAAQKDWLDGHALIAIALAAVLIVAAVVLAVLA